ncbi:MAG: hypothetical protein IJ971_01175 [Bacteroidales bacterium]|nr:hypothetical protein [Bacteroidales bacterium]
MKKSVVVMPDAYCTPSVIVYDMSCEGVICASGTHDPLTEDDDWTDYIK